MRFFCFLLFLKWNFLPFSPFNAALSEEFSHFLSSCGIYQSKLTFFSPSAVFSLKNNPHSFLRRELGFWQLALSSSIFSPSSFSRLFTVVFPPLWVHTHTNTETAQLLFRFLNSKSPVKLQLFRTHNIPILASFFCFIFVRFQFSSPNFFATATENPPLLEAFSGRVFFFLILRDAGQISSLIFLKRRKFYLLTFIGALVYPQKKSSKRYHSLLFSLTTRIFQKRRIQLDTNQSSLTVLARNKQSEK